MTVLRKAEECNCCELSKPTKEVPTTVMEVLHLMPFNLSEVELAVLYMMVRGCPTTEVRQRLGLSEEQIHLHISTIYEALAVSGQAELLSLADRVASKSGVRRQPRTQGVA